MGIVLLLANYTVDMSGEDIEKCNIKLVTRTFSTLYLWNNTVGTIKTFKKKSSKIKPGVYVGQHPKYDHHDLSGRNIEVGTVNHN